MLKKTCSVNYVESVGKSSIEKHQGMKHIWIVRTTNGRVGCISGPREDAEEYARGLVKGTTATYEIIE